MRHAEVHVLLILTCYIINHCQVHVCTFQYLTVDVCEHLQRSRKQKVQYIHIVCLRVCVCVHVCVGLCVCIRVFVLNSIDPPIPDRRCQRASAKKQEAPGVCTKCVFCLLEIIKLC